jgi:hypothetical protein
MVVLAGENTGNTIGLLINMIADGRMAIFANSRPSEMLDSAYIQAQRELTGLDRL